MRPITFLLAILAVAPLTTVAAQELPLVIPGWRVRATVPTVDSRRVIGTVVSWQPSSADLSLGRLVLEAEEPDHLRGTQTFPIASITKLEVSRGRTKLGPAKLGAIGGAIGALVGFVVGGIETDDPSGADPVFTSEEGALLGAVLFGGAGVFIGAMIGEVKVERWGAIPLDRLRVSFAPQRDGRFALGVSVGF